MGKNNRRPLFKYQREMFWFLREHPRAGLFVDMRLGKTLVTIRHFSLVKKPRRFLIVCPNSAVESWITELQNEGFEEDTILLQAHNAAARLKRLQMGFEWNVINKEGFLAIPEISRVDWTGVVLDETGLFFRNPKAKVTKFFMFNFTDVPYKVILTGTPTQEGDKPASSGLLELYPQLKFISPTNKVCGYADFWKFRSGMFMPHPNGYDWTPQQGTKDKIRQTVAKNVYILKRKHVEMDQPKVKEVRYIDMPKKIRSKYDQIENEFFDPYKDEYNPKAMLKYKIEQFTRLIQLASGVSSDNAVVWDGKIKELDEILNKGELAKENAVVWVRHKPLIFAIQRKFPDAEAIYGDISPQKRRSILKRFRKGSTRVLVCQEITAQTGLNLACCDTAIYVQQPSSVMAYKQTEDRILKAGEKSPLLYLSICTRNSIDADMRSSFHVRNFQTEFEMQQMLIASLVERRAKQCNRSLK